MRPDSLSYLFNAEVLLGQFDIGLDLMTVGKCAVCSEGHGFD